MKEKNKSALSKIPRTGRIGRFAKIIEKELGEKVLLKVMQDLEKYASFKSLEQAAWWKSAVERLEKEVGNEKATIIMNFCGQKCCDNGQNTRCVPKNQERRISGNKESILPEMRIPILL